MIRMKNRLNQTVVGDNYQNPVDSEVTNIWHDKGVERGKVVMNGKKYPVRSVGGGVWILLNNVQISDIYPETYHMNKRKAS